VGDLAGPAGSVLLNLTNWIGQDDKLAWDKLRKIMPSSLRYLGDAGKAFKEGAVKDSSGAKVLDPNTWDLLGIAVGARPKEVSDEYTVRTLAAEQAAFWINRRSNLIKMGTSVFLDRAGDREATADFVAEVSKYNHQIPDPALRLTITQVREALHQAMQNRVRRENHLGLSKQGAGLERSLRQAGEN